MARNASSNNTNLPTLLDDSSYNITHQLEKKADFLYTAVQEYIRDAEEDNKPELIILWKKMKERRRTKSSKNAKGRTGRPSKTKQTG
jgi:hypothetical protein